MKIKEYIEGESLEYLLILEDILLGFKNIEGYLDGEETSVVIDAVQKEIAKHKLEEIK